VKVGERFAGEGASGFRLILRVDRDLSESPIEWIDLAQLAHRALSEQSRAVDRVLAGC
jgi:hypothetical protein